MVFTTTLLSFVYFCFHFFRGYNKTNSSNSSLRKNFLYLLYFILIPQQTIAFPNVTRLFQIDDGRCKYLLVGVETWSKPVIREKNTRLIIILKKNLTFPLSLSLYRYHSIIHRYHFYRRKLYTMYALVQLFREKNFFFHSSSKIHDQSLIKLDINDPKRFS